MVSGPPYIYHGKEPVEGKNLRIITALSVFSPRPSHQSRAVRAWQVRKKLLNCKTMFGAAVTWGLAGHSSLETTMRYYNQVDDYHRAKAAQGMDAWLNSTKKVSSKVIQSLKVTIHLGAPCGPSSSGGGKFLPIIPSPSLLCVAPAIQMPVVFHAQRWGCRHRQSRRPPPQPSP